MTALGDLTLDLKDDQILLSLCSKSSQDLVLRAELGVAIPKTSDCRVERKDRCIVVQIGRTGTLAVAKSEHEQGTRYDVEWELGSPVKKAWLSDVIDMSGSHWYGAAQVRSQQWPVEKWRRPVSAFVCGDSFADQYGGVQERYWLSSNGVAIFVVEDCPLFVGMNEGGDSKLKLVAKFEKPYKNVHNRSLYLKYSIYQSSDVKTVHQMVAKQRLAPPTCIPDELMFRHPIWSTWAKYKTKISQQIVIEYAQDINQHGFKSCQIEIDDDWTPSYGDMTFDPKKFPDPKAMVDKLKAMGHRVTLWVHPFASPWAKACFNGISHCWVRSGMLPGVTKWWNGIARHLDVTNPAATEWFKDSLKKLQQDYDITSFKFDAGEVNWLPPAFRFHKEVQNPNVFTKRYAELACEVDSEVRCHEVRVGWRTQHLPVFVRMMDKDSNWSYDNGLKTLIPHALTFSLLGYPFILPDMIGGNAYKTEFPERELFIRWLQATALMPALQFSIPPWTYDPEVVDISRSMCLLHLQFADYIISVAKDCVVTGEPIVRPLWWINPGDNIALSIDSEFLVGNRVLVAPVLDPGVRKRDVYIPLGKWRDQLTGQVVEGPVWLRGYKAELDQLPHYVLESNSKGNGMKLGRQTWASVDEREEEETVENGRAERNGGRSQKEPSQLSNGCVMEQQLANDRDETTGAPSSAPTSNKVQGGALCNAQDGVARDGCEANNTAVISTPSNGVAPTKVQEGASSNAQESAVGARDEDGDASSSPPTLDKVQVSAPSNAQETEVHKGNNGSGEVTEVPSNAPPKDASQEHAPSNAATRNKTPDPRGENEINSARETNITSIASQDDLESESLRNAQNIAQTESVESSAGAEEIQPQQVGTEGNPQTSVPSNAQYSGNKPVTKTEDLTEAQPDSVIGSTTAIPETDAASQVRDELRNAQDGDITESNAQ